MKLLSVFIGCVFLHQAAAVCKRTYILVDTLPPGYVSPTGTCPTTCIYMTIPSFYPYSTSMSVTMHDAVLFLPTSLSTPRNTAGLVSGDFNIKRLADRTNVYFLTSNLETTAALNVANNKLIIGMVGLTPNVHILDYNAYLTTVPLPAPSAANPCSFFATSPPTIAGACPRSTCNRTVILTDEPPPFIDPCPCCPGSCTYYTMAKYLAASSLGLGPDDMLVIIPTWFTQPSMSTFGNYADTFIGYLSTTTKVYVFTTPNNPGNPQINAIPLTYPNVEVKNYAAYTCSSYPMGSCACKYIAAGMP